MFFKWSEWAIWSLLYCSFWAKVLQKTLEYYCIWNAPLPKIDDAVFLFNYLASTYGIHICALPVNVKRLPSSQKPSCICPLLSFSPCHQLNWKCKSCRNHLETKGAVKIEQSTKSLAKELKHWKANGEVDLIICKGAIVQKTCQLDPSPWLL